MPNYYNAPQVDLAPPNKRPCRECPYRRTSCGPIPNTKYTFEVEGPRIWDLVRDGVTGQTCHLTDQRQLAFSPEMKIPEDRPVHLCTGASEMVARELDRLDNEFGGDHAAYARAHPTGLTAKGAEFWREGRRRFPDSFRGFVDVDQLRDPREWYVEGSAVSGEAPAPAGRVVKTATGWRTDGHAPPEPKPKHNRKEAT